LAVFVVRVKPPIANPELFAGLHPAPALGNFNARFHDFISSTLFHPRDFKVALFGGEFADAQFDAKRLLQIVGRLAQFTINGVGDSFSHV
jgi:hypothetical protein